MCLDPKCKTKEEWNKNKETAEAKAAKPEEISKVVTVKKTKSKKKSIPGVHKPRKNGKNEPPVEISPQ
jgi:hypothetical protein